MLGSSLEKTLVVGSVGVMVLAAAAMIVGFTIPEVGFVNGNIGVFGLPLFVVWGYAIYWAFDIRKALSTREFRNQALGIGLVSLGWTLFNVVFFLGGYGLSFPYVDIPVLTFAVLVTFYWTDTSILVALKTDPLMRNTLRWRQVRLVLWAVFVATVVLALSAANAYIEQYLPQLTLIYGPIGIVNIFILIVVTAGAFLVSVVRSKNSTLRRHLAWFGLSLGTWIGFLAFAFGSVEQVGGAQVLAYASFSYCLYRSAKSLAPLNKVATVQPVA
jgi:hypothetical protein